MPTENFEEFDDDLKRRRRTGVSRRESLQPIAFKGGIPSAERARTGGITSAAFINLLAPEDFSQTGATGAPHKAIQASRRIKHNRQINQLLATMGGQQLQEEAATGRATASNLTKLREADLRRRTSLETAEGSRVAGLEKQRLIGEQGLTERGLSEQAALDRLKFSATEAEKAEERGVERGITGETRAEERKRKAANEARAFELFKGGDAEGAERFSKTPGAFTPSFQGLAPPSASSQYKYIPGQKGVGRGGIETQLPGKVFNLDTGELETDISDLSSEERDALLDVLEKRRTQGLQ